MDNLIINDEYILTLFITEKGKLNRNRFRQVWLDSHKEIKEYLYNRYDDSSSIKETIARIKYHIEDRPVCPMCGKSVMFLGFNEKGQDKQLYSQYCSLLCANKDIETRLKKLFERYGVTNVYLLESVKDKIKLICLEKYGVEYSGLAELKKLKTKQTFLEHYGVDHIFKSELFKLKSKEACLEKYGVEYSLQSNIIKEKAKLTCVKKYGVEYSLSADEIRSKIRNTVFKKYGGPAPIYDDAIKQKIKDKYELSQEKLYITKKKNGTFNTSNPENELYEYIKIYFPNVIRSYKSILYPFNCDFYIPELDLYIEYQGSWTHGTHPYNENDINDIELVNRWKAKNSSYYDNAIKTWTLRDVKKRNIAKENQLNYKELWNLEEAKLFINLLIK